MVTVEDNQPVDLRQDRESAFHRVTRSTRRVLDDGDDIGGAFDPLGEIDGFGCHDEHEGIRPHALAGAEHARDHGKTSDGVQRFRQ